MSSAKSTRGHDLRDGPGPERTPRVGVRAAIVRDGAILMNRYRYEDHEVYDLPGGGQQHGETQADALRRECREEIGADVRVHSLACVYETLSDVAVRTGEQIPRFHQVNLVLWAELEPGQEPGEPEVPDVAQVGTAWLPIDELDRFRVVPAELGAWLRADPSARPVGLGTLTSPAR